MNGKPGDDPLSDVVKYGQAVYGDPIDDLLRQVHARGGFGGYLARRAVQLFDFQLRSYANTIEDPDQVRGKTEWADNEFADLLRREIAHLDGMGLAQIERITSDGLPVSNIFPPGAGDPRRRPRTVAELQDALAAAPASASVLLELPAEPPSVREDTGFALSYRPELHIGETSVVVRPLFPAT